MKEDRPNVANTRPETVLVADDDQGMRESLSQVLKKEGYHVLLASSGQEALDFMRREAANVLLADLKMPGMDGVELLRSAKRLYPELEVILITGYGTVEKAVEAMKEGAYDFITKPFKRMDIGKAVKKALEKQALSLENVRLRHQLAGMQGFEGIVGDSAAMRQVLETVEQVAPSSATILIQGESGTGKEVIAQAIHNCSTRRNKSFIKVSCAALPETLLESELFGYERGAFTGAHAQKKGRFELADGGTLLLDEVSEISPSIQVKLLRVLQEGEFERLGGMRTIRADVRLVAATNADLAETTHSGAFREDLFYRLNVITISLPPLRDRRDDIPLLAEHFIRLYCKRNERRIRGIAREAMDALMNYDWPGNVRELENMVERAVVLTKGEVISLQDLPPNISGRTQAEEEIVIPMCTPLREVEDKMILETLRFFRGDKNAAAKALGIATRTIYRRLKKYRNQGGT